MPEIDISQIQSHNPWWIKAELIEESPYLTELEEEKFIYQHPLLTSFPYSQDALLTLRGPRRIGKTTLIIQITQKLLLKEKIPPQNILFYPCDTLVDFKELHQLLNSYLDYIRPRTNARIYIFLDEISFVKEWQRAVKQLADSRKFKNATLLITGSNILDILFSSEKMPGRRGDVFPWDLDYLPLTFNQYLELVSPQDLAESFFAANANIPRLRKHLNDYLLTGGFPVTINEFHKKGYLAPKTYEIFLNWIEGDLHKVRKSEKTAYNIIHRLFVHLTSKTSYYKLTRESGLSSNDTVREYLEIFAKMFLTFNLPRFTVEQKKVEPRKNRKFYFTDPFIYNTLKAKIDGFLNEAFRYSKETIVTAENMPSLVENLVAANLARKYQQIYVGQTSLGEVDIVGFKESQYHYFEVKYQKEVYVDQFKELQKKVREPLFILTRQNYEENLVNLIPVEAFLAVK